MKNIILKFLLLVTAVLVIQQTIEAAKISNPLALIKHNAAYVVFDLETTGLSPFKDEIIEIGAVKVNKEGQIVDTFTTLVKPARPVSDFIQNLTGISNEMLKDAPSIYVALPRFASFAGDAILVGHNVTFDIAFIQQKAKVYKDMNFMNPYIDTLSLTRKKYPNLKSYKLQDLIKEFNLKTFTAHRALADVVATQQLYELLKKKNS